MNEKNSNIVKFIFVSPKTQSFGEMILNDSQEPLSLKYEDIVKEIQKYINDFKLNSYIRELIIRYAPFIIDIENKSIQELTPEVKEKEFVKDIKNQNIKKSIKKELFSKNSRNINNIEEKLNKLSSFDNDYNKKFFDRFNFTQKSSRFDKKF